MSLSSMNIHSNMDLFKRKKVLDRFGLLIETNIPLYQACLSSETWNSSPTTENFNNVQNYINKIKHPALKSAIICYVFNMYLGPKLHIVAYLIHKARKVPKDQILVRMCSMDANTTKTFLSILKSLLNDESLFVVFPLLSLSPSSNMDSSNEGLDIQNLRDDLTESLRLSPFQKAKLFMNGFIGRISDIFETKNAINRY